MNNTAKNNSNNTMRYLSVSALLSLLCMAAMLTSSEARIRASRATGTTNEERALAGNYYNYYYKNNYNNNNNNNNNNNANAYRNYGYNNGYNNNNNVDHYDDIYGDVTDDKWSNATYYDDDTFAGKVSQYEKQAERAMYNWYETSPGEWTSTQWGFVAGMAVFVGGFFFCFIRCCCFCCGNGSSDYDSFDEYVAMDSSKRRSHSRTGRRIKPNHSESTDIDDDATADPIMNHRSID